MENALSLWKVYLSRLEDSPINTYTTTEIIALFRQEALAEGLQIIDRSIYRGLVSGETEKAFTILKNFSDVRYQKIKIDIINA
jgi:CRISPR/Cas system-associated protein endoribonuclease Cas2